MYLVDPQPDAALKEKAPQLWEWAESHQFAHVEATAEEVLEKLRRAFSIQLLSRLIHDPNALSGLSTLKTDDAFAIRRDLAGVNDVARDLAPTPLMNAFAQEHLTLMSSGALYFNGRYTVGDRRVRVVQAAGQKVSDVRARFQESAELAADLDVVVCAGAADDGDVSANILGRDGEATVIRGGAADVTFVNSALCLVSEISHEHE